MAGSSTRPEFAPPGHQLLRALVAWTPIALLMGLLAWTGLRGVDFGYRWDEYEAQIQPVQWSLDERTLLPNYYLYPSVNYGLNLAALFPTLCRDLLEGASAEDLAADLRAATDQPQYLLGLRSIRVLPPRWRRCGSTCPSGCGGDRASRRCWPPASSGCLGRSLTTRAGA